MLKELNLSVDYLKAISGKFDVETIFTLTLADKSDLLFIYYSSILPMQD